MDSREHLEIISDIRLRFYRHYGCKRQPKMMAAYTWGRSLGGRPTVPCAATDALMRDRQPTVSLIVQQQTLLPFLTQRYQQQSMALPLFELHSQWHLQQMVALPQRFYCC